MKKILSTVFAVIIFAVSAFSFASCGEDGDPSVPAGMKLASTESSGCKLYVPENWICDVASGATTAYYSTTDASNVSVMTFSAEYSDYTVENWWEEFKKDFEKVYSDFEIISSDNTTLDGNAAMKFVYKGTLEEKTYQFMQVVTVRTAAFSAPQVTIFTYTSRPADDVMEDLYSKHLDDVQKMLDNFKFN